MEIPFSADTILNAIMVTAAVITLNWRLATKADIKRLDDRIDKLDTKIDQNYAALDAKIDQNYTALDKKIDNLRLETKVDMQRLEDRLQSANEYHARSVNLLDAIHRELSDRREPL